MHHMCGSSTDLLILICNTQQSTANEQPNDIDDDIVEAEIQTLGEG